MPYKKKTTLKDGPIKGIYATKKWGNKYIIAFKYNHRVNTMISISGVQEYNRQIKRFKDIPFKKVPFANLKLIK